MEISRGELAALIRVSERTVTDLAKEGIVVRTERGKYDMEASVGNYCDRLREGASGRGGNAEVESLAQERARLAKEQADGHALKNASLRGELVSSTDVAITWGGILSDVRAAMLAVPSRIQQKLAGLTLTDVETIDSEIRDALSALGNDDTAA